MMSSHRDVSQDGTGAPRRHHQRGNAQGIPLLKLWNELSYCELKAYIGSMQTYFFFSNSIYLFTLNPQKRGGGGELIYIVLHIFSGVIVW